MYWPSCCPDLNSIEHVWIALKYEIYELYRNLHELKNSEDNVEIFKSQIKKKWERIVQEHIQKLVAPIPAWLDACQDARGWYKKY